MSEFCEIPNCREKALAAGERFCTDLNISQFVGVSIMFCTGIPDNVIPECSCRGSHDGSFSLINFKYHFFNRL
jgi:hypothetical protein